MRETLLPHWESYRAFRRQLGSVLQGRLQEVVDALFDKRKLRDRFKVTLVLADLDSPEPSATEEHNAWIRGETLQELLKPTINLGGFQWVWTLGSLPRLTTRGTFVRNGAEYCLLGELRQAPGFFLEGFFPTKNEMELEAVAKFRPMEGTHLTLRCQVGAQGSEPQGPVRVVFASGRWLYLDTFLDFMGVAKDGLENLFIGTTGFHRDISYVARGLGLGSWLDETALSIGDADKRKIKERTRQTLFASRLGAYGRAQLNRRIRQLGSDYVETSPTLTPADLHRLLLVYQAFMARQIPEDDRWDLANRRVMLVGDRLEEATHTWGQWLAKRLAKALSVEKPAGGDALKELLVQEGRTLFDRSVWRWLFGSPLCQRIAVERNNFVEAAALTRRIQFSGTGHRQAARAFHWSHYGRLCPLDTPQSQEVGTTVSLAWGARINPFGVIETRCKQVRAGGETVCIEAEDVFVDPWREVDEPGWIAFPDQREALARGEDVFAHKGPERFKQIAAREVAYIHADEDALFGIAANLLPRRAHNDAVRGNMACSYVRQALPLRDAKPPRLRTGYETTLPQCLPFDYGLRREDGLAFGCDLLVGYLPWKGWNFEDALVISESAAGALTSLHDERARIGLRRRLQGQAAAFAQAGRDEAARCGTDLAVFDERGFVRCDVVRKGGDPLVVEPGHKTHTLEKTRRGGTVIAVDAVDGAMGGAWIVITLRHESPACIGDKLSNRHGHKGVISRIFPDHEMPYFLTESEVKAPCRCGQEQPHRHLQVLINPLTVISRMNLGQLYETVESRSEPLRGLDERVACFDPTAKAGDQFVGDVLIGEQYLMKLDHNAENKMHGRSRVPWSYNAFAQQPLQGRRREGGQRLGEMETWALMAHNTPALLQEMLTLKSDNPPERALLFRLLLCGVAGWDLLHPRLPEALQTLTTCCYGLGLQLEIKTGDAWVDAHNANIQPDSVQALRLSLLDQCRFKSEASQGEVRTPQISDTNGRRRFHPEGLESEQIFGPVESYICACKKYDWRSPTRSRPERCDECGVPLLPRNSRRRRMGHIELAAPVPNPFLPVAPWAWLDIAALLEDRLRFRFDPGSQGEPPDKEARMEAFKIRMEEGWRRVEECWNLAVAQSPTFKRALEAKLATEVVSLTPPPAWGELIWLLRQRLGLEDLIDAPTFIEQAKRHYGNDPKALAAMSGLMVDVLEQTGISGIDFFVELLQGDADGRWRGLVLNCLPVVPPDLRRRFETKVNRTAAQPRDQIVRPHDLNALYQGVLRANSRLAEALRKLNGGRAGQPDADQADQKALKNEYQQARLALQLAVSQLMCNQLLPFHRRARDWKLPGQPVRQSLLSQLEDKDGLILGHLLGKRVDYSGRAVIVPDPTLPLDQCRLPLGMALRLYRPQLLAALRQSGETNPDLVIAQAEAGDPAASQTALARLRAVVGDTGDSRALAQAWRSGAEGAREALAKALEEHLQTGRSAEPAPLVLLNRQPTLHRLGLLAFETVIGTDAVIAIPSLVTRGYNADFDGDAMAVYLPLTPAARQEAQRLQPSEHLWHPAHGRYALSLEQDLALGGYCLWGKSKEELARDFERQTSDTRLLANIESFKEQAYAAATRANISFGIKDLQALEKATGEAPSGDSTNEPANIIEGVVKKRGPGDVFYKIIVSGARGNWGTLNYLAGRQSERRGSNLTAGLNVGEQLLNARDGRDKMIINKFGPGYAGGLTKECIGWAQGLWITEDDCGTREGIEVEVPAPHAGVQDALFLRLYGRVLAAPYGALAQGTRTDADIARRLAEQLTVAPADHEVPPPARLLVRSPMACDAWPGVCRTCYGLPITRGREVRGWGADERVAIGERVGVIAAQAVSEPLTQMALRSKHGVGGGGLAGDPEQLTNEVRGKLKTGDIVGLDGLYRNNGAEVSSIHFETICAGIRKARNGWVGDVAATATNQLGLRNVFFEAALSSAEDTLEGLQERTLLGARLPEVNNK